MKILNRNDKILFTFVTFVTNKAKHFISENVCKKNKTGLYKTRNMICKVKAK